MTQPPRSYATPTALPPAAPPVTETRVVEVVRERLFPSPLASMATLLLGAAVALGIWNLVRWGIFGAVWFAPGGAACRTAEGACWAVIAEKYRVILFGAYPYVEQWRGWIVIALWLGWGAACYPHALRTSVKLVGWAVVAIVSLVLMHGGVFGLSTVGTDLWGGLPLTFLIFGGTIAGGLPLAVLLALGRRSALPAIHALSVATIEGVRGLPLLAVLFFAALIMPLFLPPQLTFDKLIRAEIGMILFFAAYAAEVVRGGLQAIPEGQEEAAMALGLGYWPRMVKVILPQALAISLPALFNDIVRAFKNTTFFSILGLFDVLGATKTALQDSEWVRYGLEGYLFVFLLYFVICTGLSSYGAGLERVSRSRERRTER